ncbi:MAG TPA: protein kinase [Bryobacteraceae bacterium]|jgi:DNA-binding LytR/AlgR family response regulator
MVGRTIHQYRLLEKLGSGGMGDIYKAQDTRLNRFVAVKVLTSTGTGAPERRRRFIQEAQAASALNHPNIITIHDIISDGDTEFMVMEYVAGKTLVDLIPKSGLSVPDVLNYGVQMADALEAAHRAGIVHRDLKPGNVMVTESGLVKVLDFGMAKLTDRGPFRTASGPEDRTETISEAPLTVEGSLIGTVNYMSPEQAQGKKVDARSDIFSFGVVLYQMTTGTRAFSGESTVSTLSAILRDEVKPIAETVPDVPPQLELAIARCLRKNPDDRWQTMKDVHTALAGLKREADSGALHRGRAAETQPAAAKAASDKHALKAVIVDDEELARQLLREYLWEAGGVEVVAECANGFDAVKAIGELKPDLVFLDVQMPKLDGFEVLELIDPPPAVIFVTAYDQFAMKAFDAHAVDYLLKPFHLERFRKALEKARARLGASVEKARPSAAELTAAARPPGVALERIVVKDGSKVHIIPVEKLDYVEAQDDYVALHSEKKSYLKQQTIASVEEQLDPKRFVRIHRSYIVNLERIARIEPYTKDSRVAVLLDGTQLPVSRSGHGKLKGLLGENV